MEDVVENKKLPWPSRLSNSSKRFVILGIIIFVLGIPLASSLGPLGSFVILSGTGVIVLAFVCALIAFVGILCSKSEIPGTGRALGVIIISIPFLGLLSGIAGPSFIASLSIQSRTDCASNMKMLILYCTAHKADHKKWPIPEKWYDLIKPYSQDKDKKYFQCPKDKTGPCSYAMNKNIPAEANDLPPDLVLLFESAPGWNQTGGPEDVVTDRHDKNNPGANIAFADGSVKFVKAAGIPKLRWTIEGK